MLEPYFADIILSRRRLPFFSHPELATNSRSVSPSVTGFHLKIIFKLSLSLFQLFLYLSIYLSISTHLNLSSSFALVKGQLASSRSRRTFQRKLLPKYFPQPQKIRSLRQRRLLSIRQECDPSSDWRRVPATSQHACSRKVWMRIMIALSIIF